MAIAGETSLYIVDLAISDFSVIDTIIFTFKGRGVVTKTYPKDITYQSGKFFIPLRQQDTISLQGNFDIQAQINYKNKSVAKTSVGSGEINSTLATKIIDGNMPSGNEANITLTIEGNVIIASIISGGGKGVDGATFTPSITSQGILSWSNNKNLSNPPSVSLMGPKGDKGDKGDTGPKGDTGSTGEPGTTPHIGENGNWYIGDTDTGIPTSGGSGGSGGSYTETDPTVPSWAKQPSKPTYTASEVGADAYGSAASALSNAKSYTDTKISNLIDNAPESMDTLKEVSDALANNQNVVDALNAAIGNKADKSEIPSAYTLPTASANKLGGVKPVAKTSEMTQQVGVDGNGALYTKHGVVPVRGTDYWTPEDISVIETYCHDYIDSNILGGAS